MQEGVNHLQKLKRSMCFIKLARPQYRAELFVLKATYKESIPYHLPPVILIAMHILIDKSSRSND